jgi:uncharacterized LabA/DUF88 family protein
MKKIAIFVDVQNIYYTTKEAYGRQFDYKKFWRGIETQGEIVLANAYAIQSNQDGQIKFQDALGHIGFSVKLKPFIQRSDGSAKGDWDVGITIDIMEAAKDVDIVVLLSGDGDFDLLLTKITKHYDVQAHVYSVSSLTAKSLIEAASLHFPIEAEMLL